MSVLHGDAARALSSIEAKAVRMIVYRAVRGNRSGVDPTPEIATARYNRGQDRFPSPTWPALYTSVDPGDPQVQIVRHSKSLEDLRDFYRIAIETDLSLVYDISDPGILGSPGGALTRPVEPGSDLADSEERIRWAYGPPHELALAAIGLGAEAIIVPSAGIEGTNMLIIFPDSLREGSVVREVSRQRIHFRQ